MLAIVSCGHHGTTASSSSLSANPISNPAHPENTVNVPVGTPAPRSQMVSGPFYLRSKQTRQAPSPSATARSPPGRKRGNYRSVTVL